MVQFSILNAVYLYIAINSPIVILAIILYLYSKILRKHRAHYFEFHDYGCCPSFVRDFGTNFLKVIYRTPLPNGKSVANLVLPYLQETLKECKSQTVLDLGSGSGGVVPYIQTQFNKKSISATCIMTDLYPNIKQWDRLIKDIPNLSYIPQSIDAMKLNENSININNVNSEATRITRSMFTFMHHFRSSELQNVLNDTIDHDQGFFAFEPGVNNISEYLVVILFLFIPLFAFITSFTMRPYPWKTILFFPFTNWIWMHDGIVSYSRIYSTKNWLKLATECSKNKNKKYQWDVKDVVLMPHVITIRIYTGIPLSDVIDV